jgi:hypothetical protein
VISADLDDQIAFFLRRVDQIPPIVQCTTTDARRIEHGAGRQGRRVHDPGRRDQRAQNLQRATAQRLAPEILQEMVMEERERELLLLKMPHRRRDRDFTRLPRFENEFLRPDVLQVEELEEAVKDVDFLRIAFHVEEQRVLERKNILRLHAKHALAQELELMRQPFHLRAISRGLIADHQRDQGIARFGS